MMVVVKLSCLNNGILLHLFYRKRFYSFNGEGTSLEAFGNGSGGELLTDQEE